MVRDVKIKLGDKVRDKITGFEGIVTAEIKYMYGCLQYRVTPKIGNDGNQLKSDWIDKPQLELIENGEEDKSAPKHGGMRHHP